MNILLSGIIVTSVIISVGILLVLPHIIPPEEQQPLLLSIEITDEQNLPTWCREAADVLKKYNIGAAVFLSGKLAEKYPDCITSFSSKVDIGSQTYSYVSLPGINDYQEQLSEVQKGKETVDNIGTLDSKLFRAPFGQTDQNIYSLLSRNDIDADFSYETQYNKFYNEQFIRFDLTYMDKLDSSQLSSKSNPILVDLDNTVPIKQLEDFVIKADSAKMTFVSASELTGMDLTVRG